MYKHILAATDGSAMSARALQSAVELAQVAHARVTFVNCTVPFDVYAADPMMMTQRDLYEEACQKTSEEYLELGRRLAHDAGVPCDSVHVVSTQPWRGILDIAKQVGCDLVVMASHGRHGLAGLVLGSETHKVLTHGKLPVLVVR
jgi:nucleotide-binding universal stress UspA family protein